MSQNTLAEYRNLYRNRHGIQCPLSDAQIRTAMGTASVLEDAWPLSLAVLTAIQDAVTIAFPAVDQNNYAHGGELQVSGLVASDITTTTLTLDWNAATGGEETYLYQVQQSDDDGETWEDVGEPIEEITLALTGLTADTAYSWRVTVTDDNLHTATSNVVSETTYSLLVAPDDFDAVAGTPDSTAVDLSWSAATGGLAPYAYQPQQAPDAAGSPGTWSNVGSPQAGLTKAITGLTPETKYHWRVVVTDALTQTANSNSDTVTTAAA